MEPNNNKLEDIDPDYKINNTALRKIEEKEKNENKLTYERVSKIIAEEFDKELAFRQKQLEEIEDKICKAQKLLHLIRYVLITSYYNKKNLEYSNLGQEYDSSSNFDVQNRMHPAIKKLLGQNTSLEVLASRGKRKAYNKNGYGNQSVVSQSPITKKIKLEHTEDCESSFKSQMVDDNQNLQKNRKRSRYRIIVGNISKWMPSLENDNTTHKWMVYVRGLKEAVDISHVVKKVVFYLHPSYKPHDVIEISNYPFHLSRRGWGEFPLRVQIFFKCSLNKPVSIVHNLKLDKTYTGRQTLGNETIVDVYLHDNDFNLQSDGIENESPIEELDENFINGLKCELTIKEEQIDSPGISDFVKTEPLLVNDTTEDLASTSNEHNYCYEKDIVKDNVVEDVNVTVPIPSSTCFLLDHSYSLPYSEHKDSACDNNTPRNKTDIKPNQSDNNLIYGLGESYTENDVEKGNAITKCRKVEPSVNVGIFKTFTTATGQPIRFLPQSFNKLLLSNGNIVQIRLIKRPQSVIRSTNSNSPIQHYECTEEKIVINENYEVTLPKNRFKNMGEALPYLFKRLPLYSTTANCIEYKCMYPFTATSEVEFSSWNIGKRINSEWCRAKAIKKILSGENFPNLGLWDTKTFFMYGRSHGYSPFALHSGLFRRHSKEVELLKTCFMKSVPQSEFSLESGANDIVIDITANTDSTDGKKLSLEKNNFIDISDASLNSHCAFVKEAALDCGVTLKPEEISKGVTMNAAERVMLEAVRCFAEGLIRRSRCHLICGNNASEQCSEITVREVKMALNERPEIKSIVNFQKKKREIDFFS